MIPLVIFGVIAVAALVLIDLALMGILLAAAIGIGTLIWMSGGTPAIAGMFWIGVLGWLVYALIRNRARIAAKVRSIRTGGVQVFPGDKVVIIGAVVFFGLFMIAGSLGL
jgi:hypothetical protein